MDVTEAQIVVINGVYGMMNGVVKVNACSSLVGRNAVVLQHKTLRHHPNGNVVVVFEHQLGWGIVRSGNDRGIARCAGLAQIIDIAENMALVDML